MRKICSITVISAFAFISICSCNIRNLIETVPAREFAEVIANPEVQLIDVRSVEEFLEGNIEGSVNISLAGEDFCGEVERKLDKTRPVAVYCRGGRQSAEAAEKLSSMGFKVFELENGYNAWNNNDNGK
ncbi:MAG: rhodanese-like domain-containing protein [Bacteroidales bacterium]|nr:rhodanese-like domain-containing protein [Bacteroidales bacterium]